MNHKFRKLTAFLTGIVTVISCTGIVPQKNASIPVTADAASGSIPAFPGAVGGGKYATGGRGGEVYHVTNLNDSGEGSFRDAVSKSGRIVVFDVSGTIELKSNILCQSNITIAGQTAPGGSGITLKNYKMGMAGDNIICRYISSRPGPDAATSSGNDAWGGANGSNSIIDHCSMGWTTDEQWGLYSNNMNYTVQYSVLGPADSWGGHKKGLHGFGLMMGKGNLSFDHNLIIHNVSRNFRGKVQGTYTADFTNNIIYDWGYQTAYGTIGHLNYVNNTLKAGNSTTGGYHLVSVDSSTSPENFKIYCDGNQMINKDGTINSITYDNWSGIKVKESLGITKDDLYSAAPFQTVINGENVSSVVSAESASASYDHVVNFAGNGIAPDKRTAINRQCAYETINGTGSCSGTSAYDASEPNLDKYSIECGVTYTYPSAVLKKEIIDNDNDGMADEWEEARGLNPNDPTDTNGDYCGQGYTNIEYYINDLTVDSFPAGVVQLSPENAVPPVPPVSAFETIEAESYYNQEGIQTEDLSTGGQNIGYIEDGDYTVYRSVDFGDGAKSMTARISGNPAKIELHLDNISDTPAAVVDFKGTSGFMDYQDISFNINKISGTHRLYLKFTGGEGYLLNMDSFVFGKDAIPLNGKLFTDVFVSDGALPDKWMIGTGPQFFGDRDFTITTLPKNLDGCEILMTACDAKGATGETAVFTAGDDIDLVVALDSRVEVVPEWLAAYEKLPADTTIISSNDVTFNLYKLSVKKGEKVSLGGNGQSYMCVNFFALAVPSAWNQETVKGDINGSGSVEIADIVLLQKYLLNLESLTPEQAKAADLDSDGIIDIFDNVLVRRALISKK